MTAAAPPRVTRRRAPRATVAAWLCLGVAPLLASTAHAQEELVVGQRYGDAGTSELSLALGLGSSGIAGGAGFRYFVVDGVAPGLEASFFRADERNQGLVLASVRVVPLRLSSFALVITGRGGRVFLSDHVDGWAVGGDAGVLMFFSPHVGFEIGYQVLKLLPASFCADFDSCVIHQPVLGLRITF